MWIRHEHSAAFLADPTIATIYNRGQHYERRPASPEGDRCDWFSVDDGLAREIAASLAPHAGDTSRPFQFEWAGVPAPLYYRQRALLRAAKRGEVDALTLDEQVMHIVSSVLAHAHAARGMRPARAVHTASRRLALVHDARAELSRAPLVSRSVTDISTTLGVSAFHLCRVFRAATGRTMGDYRTELRVRHALELLEASGDAGNISAVAHDAGFASHSHFVRATRRCLGEVPSVIRDALTRNALRIGRA